MKRILLFLGLLFLGQNFVWGQINISGEAYYRMRIKWNWTTLEPNEDYCLEPYYGEISVVYEDNSLGLIAAPGFPDNIYYQRFTGISTTKKKKFSALQISYDYGPDCPNPGEQLIRDFSLDNSDYTTCHSKDEFRFLYIKVDSLHLKSFINLMGPNVSDQLDDISDNDTINIDLPYNLELEDMQWQYLMPDSDFMDFPSEYIHITSPNPQNPDDIYNTGRIKLIVPIKEFIADKNYDYGQMIVFRIKSDCDLEDFESEEQTREYKFSVHKSAPKLVNATIEDGVKTYRSVVSCPDASDASVELEFDRTLREGERYKISIYYINEHNDSISLRTIPSDTLTKYLRNSTFYRIKDLPASDESGFHLGFYDSYDTDDELGDYGIENDHAKIYVDKPEELKFTLKNKMDILCKGADNGEATFEGQGGTGKYQYKLDDGAWKDFNLDGQTKLKLENLSPKEYTVRFRDTNHCTQKEADDEKKIEFEIKEPEKPLQFAGSPEIKNPTGYELENGYIVATVTGGIPFDDVDNPYVFEWRKDSPSGPIVTDHIIKQNDLEGHTQKLDNLGAGTYYLIVKDKNYEVATGNRESCILEEEFILTEPDPLEVVLQVDREISCHPDNLLSGDIQPINPNCTEDGIVRVLVTGGVEPYQLKWQKKEGNDFVDFFPSETDTILEGLTEGTYRVVVTDDDGNGLQTTEEITLNFPDQLIAELQTEDLRCYGQSNGSIQTEVTGGEAPYSYQWQKGEWGVFEDLTGKTQTVLDNVEAGTYRVIITDKRGAQTDERITLHQPDTPLSTTYEIKEPTGFGLTNGSLRVAVEGGTPFDDGTYFFQWHKDSAGGTIITEGITTQVEGDQYRIVLNDIPQGTYYLRVRDKNFENSADDPAGCELLHEFVVTEPDELVATIEVIQDISCHINNQFSRASSLDINKNGIPDNAEDGKIQVNVAGGVSPYTIQWSKKTSGNFDKISRYEELIGALGAGVYRVYIKDANDNITTDEITLIYPEELKLIVEGEDLDCQDEDGGTVTARVSGGAAGYSYYWNTSDGTASLTRQPPGKYYVMVEDAKGCTVDGVGEITYPSPLQIKTLEAQSPSCYGIYDGQIRIEVEGVTESYTVEWSNGARGETLSNLAPGTYTVKVTSEDGCFIIQEYVLTEPDPIVLNIGEGVTLCSGDSQFYNAEIEGIEALYEWVNEKNEVVSTEPQVHLSEAGTYRVQVTTVNGCVLTDEVIIKNSSEVLQPNFVATTYAFTEEVIEIINISYEEPEYMEWIIPEEAEIVSSTTGLLELKFSKSGSYEIGLYARQGDCEKLITKPIIIEDNLFSVEEPSGRVSNILDFKVAPNPNRGQFSTYIDLDEKAEIRIRMLSMQLQELRSPLIEKNQQNYVLSFDQVVASGVYFVILETGKEVRVKKVIIE